MGTDVIMSEQKKEADMIDIQASHCTNLGKMAHISMIAMPKSDHDTCC